jgi:hypothetical protein
VFSCDSCFYLIVLLFGKNKTISAPIKRISRDVLLEKTLSAAMGYIKSFLVPICGRGERMDDWGERARHGRSFQRPCWKLRALIGADGRSRQRHCSDTMPPDLLRPKFMGLVVMSKD